MHAPFDDVHWSTYAKVNHRLPMLDSPHPDGWTVFELADEYHVHPSYMQRLLRRMKKDGTAVQTEEGRWTAP